MTKTKSLTVLLKEFDEKWFNHFAETDINGDTIVLESRKFRKFLTKAYHQGEAVGHEKGLDKAINIVIKEEDKRFSSKEEALKNVRDKLYAIPKLETNL